MSVSQTVRRYHVMQTKNSSQPLKDSPITRILFVLLLIAFPFIASHFGNSWVRIIDVALLYILLALGLNIVVGFAGLLDLGYIAFFAIGAYIAGLLASQIGRAHV